MLNYIHKLNMLGVEIYKHANSGKWFYKNKHGDMKRLPLF
ncbi:hypothetical protein HNR44_000115 [Geomicrobium halophilum]|uniref:Uncharacterized protein n=1 Tax=Geomicrobium halophilum TaxID=549000 RepID=A0A841PLS2_9BACL|nr:hypothetical protein [Geomicrobium halophilum]